MATFSICQEAIRSLYWKQRSPHRSQILRNAHGNVSIPKTIIKSVINTQRTLMKRRMSGSRMESEKEMALRNSFTYTHIYETQTHLWSWISLFFSLSISLFVILHLASVYIPGFLFFYLEEVRTIVSKVLSQKAIGLSWVFSLKTSDFLFKKLLQEHKNSAWCLLFQ